MIRNLFCSLGVTLACLVSSVVAQNPTEDDYYKLEVLPIPAEAYLESGGLEMMPDGKLAVSSRRGEIWMFNDPKAKDVSSITATRYAHGLHEVLGLASHKGWLYCVQRGEVSRMKDEDGDGRADVFETVSDAWEINGDYHEYAFGTRFDKNGHLWVVLCLTGSFNSNNKFRGWCLRFDENGKMTPTCSGIRSPGGIGFNCNEDVFYTDNQGPWNGTCGLKWLQPGSFQGHPAGNRWYDFAPNMKRPIEPKSGSRFHVEADKIPEYVPPAILFPYNKMGKSASGVTCDSTAGKFGPFAGQMFVGDQTHSTVMRVFLEKVNERYQGACFMFRQGVSSGTLPLMMDKSGTMFIGGTNRGWGSRGGKPYTLERLTWTGKVPFEVHEMRAKPDGFELTFTHPVDPLTASDVDSYKISTYTYIFQASYGSPEVDHTKPTITKIDVGADNRSVRLYIDKLQRGHVHELHMAGVRSAKGLPLLHNAAYYTLNYIPKPPAVGKLGEPYKVRGIGFTPRKKDAAWQGHVYYRPAGTKEYQKAAIEQGDSLSAVIPSDATQADVEYYLQFEEAGQPVVYQPVGGANSPHVVHMDAKAPSKVASLKSADVSDLSLKLNWQAASDDRQVSGYRVHRGTSAQFACNEDNRIEDISAAVLSWQDPAPPAGETTFYAVSAVDVAGRVGAPEYIKINVPANQPPTNLLKLTASATSDKAYLKWTGELEPDAAVIEVLRGEGSSGELAVIKTLDDITTTTFIDQGLAKKTVYRYALRVVDRGNLKSEPSPPQAVKPGLFVHRINCGGFEFTAADGIPWQADRQRKSGAGIWTAKTTIAGAGDLADMYRTERWSNTRLLYDFDVHPGDYQVTLHFAETNRSFAAPGKRLFSILINGQTKFDSLDVFAKAGANKAFYVQADATVSEGPLSVELKKVKAGPAIKGIEVRAAAK